MATRSNLFGPIFEAPHWPRWRSRLAVRWGAAVTALALLGGTYAFVLAQVGGERGIAPSASSADVEVRGIEVDVTGTSAEDARQKGWRLAQREAWQRAGGPAISDSQLQGLVASIVIQREQLAPRRYIATLGVIFDRQRAGRYLGGTTRQRSSAPMLMIPVMVNAGTYTVFERRNEWQRAWAEFNPGNSRIDYVRPSGAGGDSLLLNFGQTGRRSRAWWRSTLDQYSAADVLVPIVRLDYQFPGGPVKGTFTARYGPESRVLDSFELNADTPSGLAAMMDRAVEQIDAIYENALEEGKLQPDPTLRASSSIKLDPAIQRLVDIGAAIRQREAAIAEGTTQTPLPGSGAVTTPTPDDETPQPAGPAVTSITVQFVSPDPGAFDAALSGVRGTPGVRGLAVTSTAIGGTSVMSVSFAGQAGQLASSLRSRGFSVRQSGNSLVISR